MSAKKVVATRMYAAVAAIVIAAAETATGEVVPAVQAAEEGNNSAV